MIALIITICFVFAATFTVYSQAAKPVKEKKPVKVSLLGNYYEQDGDHSAVNGGLGSQELFSNALETMIHIPIKDSSAIKVGGGFDYFTSASMLKIDKYQSSASSGTSNVSGDELRSFGSIGFDLAHKKSRSIFSPSIGFSQEYDVRSFNGGLSWAKSLRKRHATYIVGGNLIADRWMMVYPGEFRASTAEYYSGASTVTGASPVYGGGTSGETSGGTSGGSTSGGTSGGSGSGSGNGSGGTSGGGIWTGNQHDLFDYATKSGSESSNGNTSGSHYESAAHYPNATVIPVTGKTITKDGKTYPTDWRYSLALTNQYNFVVNKRSNMAVGVDLVYQNGMLSTPFHRVYFNDGVADEFYKEVRIEKLPKTRFKVAAFARYNLSVNKYLTVRTFARYYTDNWGVQGLTAQVEAPVRITSALSIVPSYRFYYQLKSKYFAGYGEHTFRQGAYYTSDYDLSGFTSNKVGGAVRYAPVKSIFNLRNKTTLKSVFAMRSAGFRYAYYHRSDGLKSQSVTVELTFEM